MAVISPRVRIPVGRTESPTVQVVGEREVRFSVVLDQTDANDPTLEFDLGINQEDGRPHLLGRIKCSGQAVIPATVGGDDLDGQRVYLWIDAPRAFFVSIERN